MGGKRLRLALAFIAAPIAASVIVGFGFALIYALGNMGSGLNQTALETIRGGLGMWMISAAFACVVALPTSLTVGLATHAIYQARRITPLWPYMLAGTATGIFVPMLFLGGLMLSVLGALIGGLTAGIAWAIRRPDKDSRIDVAATFD
jgi:hypothetical protein